MPATHKKVRVKKNLYVSPYRQEKYVPTEIVCDECKLPSFRGLPPFIKVSGKLQHRACPAEPEKLLDLVTRIRERDRKTWQMAQTFLKVRR